LEAYVIDCLDRLVLGPAWLIDIDYEEYIIFMKLSLGFLRG